MLGVERLPLRVAVLEAIAKSHPDARDWDARAEGFLRLSRFHMVYPYPGETEPPPLRPRRWKRPRACRRWRCTTCTPRPRT